MFDLEKLWKNEILIAFDTETSGKYPLDAEICEIAAVKWKNGKVIDEYQQLIKPSQPMGAEVIKIHNISNEMVIDSPSIEKVIGDFYKFIGDGYLLAHHAPFDLGFLAIEFEKNGIDFPARPVFCTSLLSRAIFTSSPNHRLQTLINYLGIEQGQAHRALDDSLACLGVALKCFAKMDELKSMDVPLSILISKQKKKLNWSSFSMREIACNSKWSAIYEAILEKRTVSITYLGGSKPGKEREVMPQGIVRSPDGDFLVATAKGESVAKRYFLRKLSMSR